MAHLMGSFVGGLILVILIGWILESFTFKETEPDPRSLYVVGIAYAVCVLGYGLISARFAAFNPRGLWVYAPGAIIAWLWFRHRYHKQWNAAGEEDVFK